MTANSVTKTEQYGLIALIAKRLGGAGRRLGKKALQKNIHLLQEFGGVDLGYRFSFYTYGPYSSELSGDLDVVASMGAVKITYNSTDNYYLIEPGMQSDQTIQKASQFIQNSRATIDRIIDTFGARLAKDLELVSTIAYLRRHSPPGEFVDDAKLKARVMALKPKYTEREIARAIAEVRAFLAGKQVA